MQRRKRTSLARHGCRTSGLCWAPRPIPTPRRCSLVCPPAVTCLVRKGTLFVGEEYIVRTVRAPGMEDEDALEAELDDVLQEDGLKEQLRAKQRQGNKYIAVAAKLLAPVIEQDIVSGFNGVQGKRKRHLTKSVVMAIAFSICGHHGQPRTLRGVGHAVGETASIVEEPLESDRSGCGSVVHQNIHAFARRQCNAKGTIGAALLCGRNPTA